MTTKTYHKVWPDVATHPGEHIQDFYEDEERIPVTQLASHAGLKESEVEALISGSLRVSGRIAAGLGEALGPSSTYWLNLQRNYDETVQRIAENKRFNMVPFKDFTRPIHGVTPIQALTDGDEVPWRYNQVEQARYLCEWLGVPNLDGYEERLLGRFQLSGSDSVPNPAPTVAWLRRGELAAIEQVSDLPPYSHERFVDAMHRLNEATAASEDAMREICNEAGVAFVAPDDIPGCEVRSATRWLDDGRPMIQLRLARGIDNGESVQDSFRRAADRIVRREPDHLGFGAQASSNGIRAGAVLTTL